MSTSKHIDVICIAALLGTLLVTGLFVNGRALGLAPLSGEAGEGDSPFTADDLNGNWDAGRAARITLTGDGADVSGSGAYALDGSVFIVRAGEYVLSGELTDGSVIVDAEKEDQIRILLDGVSLYRENSAAILVEQADKVFLTLAEGTENTVACGASFSAEAAAGKIDGAIYARDNLTINGEGSLTVTAPYKHGIVCNDDLVIAGGTIDITAAQDGVPANDSVKFANAGLTVSAGDDGITVSTDEETSSLYIESGSITIPSCYEGLEAIDITVAGGTIDIRPTDDGINANGRGGNSVIRITGGDITIINETGRDADGLDSNGSIDISGGRVFISVNTASCALDYGSENGGVCLISGGAVIAAGGSAMAEGFDSSSRQGFLMSPAPAAAGTAVTLMNGAGDTLISETVPCAFTSIVLSAPGLEVGQTVILDIGGDRTELTVDNSGSGGFGGMFGGGQGGPFGGRGGGGRRGLDSEGTQTSRTASVSTLSAAGPGGRGGMGQIPGGGFGDGEMPQMPDGGFGDGEMPRMPGGDFPGGGDAQIPDNGLPDGEMPQIPGGGWGGDRFTQWGQDQDRTQGGTPSDAGDLLNTLLPVGISVLFLLAGLVIAFKLKH